MSRAILAAEIFHPSQFSDHEIFRRNSLRRVKARLVTWLAEQGLTKFFSTEFRADEMSTKRYGKENGAAETFTGFWIVLSALEE